MVLKADISHRVTRRTCAGSIALRSGSVICKYDLSVASICYFESRPIGSAEFVTGLQSAINK